MNRNTVLEIPGLDDESVASVINGARTYSQYLDMVDKALRGVCPFCAEHFDHKKNKVIQTVGVGDDEWRLWLNPYPHAHTKYHFVIAPKRHIDHPHSMSTEDWELWSMLVSFVVDAEGGIGCDGGCIAMRFGDPTLNAGSIRHLHTNIIVPDGTGDVKVTLAKNREKQEETLRRIKIFEELRREDCKTGGEAYARGEYILSEEEFQFVKDRLR